MYRPPSVAKRIRPTPGHLGKKFLLTLRLPGGMVKEGNQGEPEKS